MYQKFNACITDFSHESEPNDYWYDCAILEATEILKQFSSDDWELLLTQLKLKPLFWQKRVVECLGDLNNSYELKVILELINRYDDEDLFISCIDSLRNYNLTELEHPEKEKLLLKIETLLNKVSPPEKNILEEFIKKINE